MKIFILSLLSLFSVTVNAKVINFKPLEMAIGRDERLLIRNFYGKVRLTPARASNVSVHLTQDNPDAGPNRDLFDKFTVTMRKEGDTVFLTVKGPEERDEWKRLMSGKNWPKITLDVTAPAVATEIYLLQGEIAVDGWTQALRVSLEGGQVHVSKGKGELKIYNGQGGVAVRAHNGAVHVESYKGKVRLDDINGPVHVENFTGDSVLTKIDGAVRVLSYQAPAQLKQIKGRVEFEMGAAALKIESLDGDLKGKSNEGAVSAVLVGDGDVRVKTGEGAVNLVLKDSGASVDLGTVEGTIMGPSALHRSETQNLKLMGGTLKGSRHGRIYVRTETGAIRVQ